MFKKPILILLMLLLSLLTFACSQQSEPEAQVIYTADRIPFPDDYGTLIYAKKSDANRIWTVWMDDDAYSIRTFDSRDALGGSLVLHLEGKIENEHQLSGFIVSDNAITMIFKMESDFKMSRISVDGNNTGTDIHEIVFSLSDDPDIRITTAVADSNDMIYVAWNKLRQAQRGLTVLSNQGEVLFTITDNSINDLFLLDADTPMVLLGNATLCEINISSESWGAGKDIDGSFGRVHTGENGILFLDDMPHLYRFDTQEEKLTMLFNYMALEVMDQPLLTISLSDDVFLMITNEGLHRIKPAAMHLPDAGLEVATQSVLTIAGDGFPVEVFSAITDFNNKNDNYRIEIREIGNADIPRFLTELATGQMPDIIFYGSSWSLLRENLPSDRLTARGLLTDLYYFIDNDPLLDRGVFYKNLLEAAQTGTALYELPYAFGLSTVAGSADLLGIEMGWTFDEMLKIMEDSDFNGYLFPSYDRKTVLTIMLEFLIDDYFDRDTGLVRFDSGDFQQLLETVKKYSPTEMHSFSDSEADMIRDGKQLLFTGYISMPDDLQMLDSYFDHAVLIGFPVSNGVGHAFRYTSSFSISSTSEHKDIAWSFISRFYTPEFYEENRNVFGGVPSNVDALEMLIDLRRNQPEVTIWHGDHFFVQKGASDYDVERWLAVLRATTRVSRLDMEIFSIVAEEAEIYFRDARDVERTSEIIQSRVQTFVWEQMG